MIDWGAHDGHKATIPDYGVGGLYSTNADVLNTLGTCKTFPPSLQLRWRCWRSDGGVGRGRSTGGRRWIRGKGAGLECFPSLHARFTHTRRFQTTQEVHSRGVGRLYLVLPAAGAGRGLDRGGGGGVCVGFLPLKAWWVRPPHDWRSNSSVAPSESEWSCSVSALRAFCTSMPRPLLCFRTPITEYASAIPHVSGIFTFSGMWPGILYSPDETRKMQDLRRVTGECSPSGSPGLSGSKKKGALRNFHPLCECEFRQITDISTFSGRIPEFTHSPADHRRMQPVRFVRFVRLEKEGETAELSHQGSGKVQSCVTAASPAAQIPQRSPLF